jgi:hypothetical protein
MMDVRADLTAACDPHELFGWVDDLGRYPEWMRLAHTVTPLPPDGSDGSTVDPSGSTPAAGSPAWSVELRARLGPLARSKRLRMVRTVHEVPDRVVFERRESDGRRHSPWVLDVRLSPRPNGEVRLDMHLHYGGGLWTGGVLERVLTDEIDRGRDRLLSVVTPTP